ncbi:MAG TPA: ATP-binding protein [Desulfuromonadaceae bacterium]
MRSLRTQISLAFVLIVLVTVSLISVASNVLIKRRFEAYVLAQQDARTANIVDNLSLQYDGLTNTWSHDSVYTLGMYSLYDGYIIKVYDKNGASVWDAVNHDMGRCQQVMDDIAIRMKEYGSVGGFVSQDYALTQDGQKVGTVSISFFGPYFLSESDVVFLNALNLLLMVIGIVSLLLSFVTGGLLARRIARPITKTADIAKQIAAGNYDIQFEGQTRTRELHTLVSALNYLADALAKQQKLRKRLTADVAHELRTPLTTIGAHLEAMIEGVWAPTPQRLQSCHDEILRLGKMVVDLERLERAESDDPRLDKAPVDMFALTRSICANFEGEFANKNLQLAIEGGASVISVDKDSMSRVITNLVSNAVKYTPNGGHIRIAVQDSAQDSVFIIEDDGSGIPEGELPFIFERFYRADKSRNRDTGGAGIGLAIVKSIVTAHGGIVTAENRPEQGSRFTVTLPKAP